MIWKPRTMHDIPTIGSGRRSWLHFGAFQKFWQIDYLDDSRRAPQSQIPHEWPLIYVHYWTL
jgi:hypothetical protein